jgi:predicted dehydrogenase
MTLRFPPALSVDVARAIVERPGRRSTTRMPPVTSTHGTPRLIRCRASVELMSRSVRVVHVTDLSEAERSLLGVSCGDTLAQGEWFVRPDARRAEAIRMPRETAVVGEFTYLHIARPAECTVLATCSIRFTDVPAIVECAMPEGEVIVTAIRPERLRTVDEHRRLLDRLAVRRDAVADRDTVGVAVVGYGPFGGMGYTHGLAATETDGLRFVAVCDSNAERRDAALADFPHVHSYADVDALCGDDAVDAVIVATPPVLHAPLALTLLRAGKHVVVEKPMCLTAADADLLLAEAARVERTITVHQSRRWDGDYLALRRAIDTGTIGDVFNIETFVGSFDHPCRWWHSDESLSGGAVYDWGSHHIDWILRIFGGPPDSVTASAHKRVWRDVTNADQIEVRMSWADGREARFVQSDVAAIRKPKFYVQGTAGTISADYRQVVTDELVAGRGHVAATWHHAEVPSTLRVARYEPGYGIVEMTLPPVTTPSWPFHRALADHLLLGEPSPVPAEQSRDVVDVLERAHRSAACGSTPVA